METLKVYLGTDQQIAVIPSVFAKYRFYGSHDNHAVLTFSEGTTVKFGPDTKGVWKFRIACRGTADIDIIPSGHVDSLVDHFSQILELTGEVQLVNFGHENDLDEESDGETPTPTVVAGSNASQRKRGWK